VRFPEVIADVHGLQGDPASRGALSGLASSHETDSGDLSSEPQVSP
jgi:hypothetical protein